MEKKTKVKKYEELSHTSWKSLILILILINFKS